MQINPRQSKVKPPSFRDRPSTTRAEKYQRKARDISFITDLTTTTIETAQRIIEYEEARELQNAEVEVKRR